MVLDRAELGEREVNPRLGRVAEPDVVRHVDDQLRVAVHRAADEAGEHVLVADQRRDRVPAERQRADLVRRREVPAVLGDLVEKREGLAEREILPEGQQIVLVVRAADRPVLVGDEGGVVVPLLPVDAPAREPAEEHGRRDVAEHVVAHVAHALRDEVGERALGPDEQIGVHGLLQLEALIDVPDLPLERVLASLGEAHIRLHEADDEFGRAGDLRVDGVHAKRPVAEHEGGVERGGERGLPRERARARDERLRKLVDRAADDDGERGQQERPAEIRDLQDERESVETRAVIEREEQRVEELAREERGDGGERRIPAAVARAAPEPSGEREGAGGPQVEHAREDGAEPEREAAEQVQHVHQPVVAAPAHHEAEQRPDREHAARAAERRAFGARELERGEERREGDERQRPEIEAGEAEEGEHAAEHGERVGQRATRERGSRSAHGGGRGGSGRAVRVGVGRVRARGLF